MTIPANQRDVADFLASLSGGPPKETHISAVFIGTDTVWKLKKAVRMPFLDFTSLQARAHFLRRELKINKPAAPGLYRDVVGISRDTDGSFYMSDKNPVEFVLRMARVPEQDFLEVIIVRNGLTPQLLDALGDTVSAYHLGLASVHNVDQAVSLLRITQGNAVSALAAGLPHPEVKSWRRQMEACIEIKRPWLGFRCGSGYIRRCHGDLHLGNICLWEGKPVPFDALEFDEALATIDVGYDIAFLLMDLDQRVGRPAANRVMNRYIARCGDVGMTAGLPIFLSQRAMVRAHVLQAMGQDGASYLSAAGTYLTPVRPLVIAIGGLQGTGKSTLARALAPELGAAPGALILRSDEIRKRLHNQPPETRLPPEAYTEAANTGTNNALAELVGAAALAGHAVIADATFLDPAVRQDIARAVAATGACFIGIWLQAPLTVLEARIASRTGDASDADIAVLHRSAADDPGPGDWVAIDATDGAQALASARQAIDRLRMTSAP